MSGKSANIGDKKKIKKSNFQKNRKVINIGNTDVNKILVFKEEPYGLKKCFKCFIGYNDDDVIRPLCIRLPKMIGYIKNFDCNKAMPFKGSDRKLLKNYN